MSEHGRAPWDLPVQCLHISFYETGSLCIERYIRRCSDLFPVWVLLNWPPVNGFRSLAAVQGGSRYCGCRTDDLHALVYSWIKMWLV